jgi:hypothetical protein
MKYAKMNSEAPAGEAVEAMKVASTLHTPAEVHEEDETIVCNTFRQYANAMMRPDPTYVKLTAESEATITAAINAGLPIFDALRGLRSDYEYDDNGREYISFPTGRALEEKLAELTGRKMAQFPAAYQKLTDVCADAKAKAAEMAKGTQPTEDVPQLERSEASL